MRETPRRDHHDSRPDPIFLPGLTLSDQFYTEGVRPIMARAFPGVRYAAARLGSGSDVLGYDDAMSTDHDWGPRLQLFLTAVDHPTLADTIHETLRQQLPGSIAGYPTHFGPPDHEGTRLLAETDGPVDHRVTITTVPQFFEEYMACDPTRTPDAADWLIWPQQHLLGVTAGRVYHDGVGELTRARTMLAYYPDDIWRYLLACQWSRIGQEEHFVGRTGLRGDDIGSALLGARLVHDLMQLCFLMERTYAPYPKWFGTAFKRLACAPELEPVLRHILAATDWQTRAAHLCDAYERVATMHNALEITDPLPTAVRPFHNRPFTVIDAGRFTSAIRATIQDPAVRAIPTDIGSIDQFSDSTDLRSYPRLHRRLKALYTAP